MVTDPCRLAFFMLGVALFPAGFNAQDCAAQYDNYAQCLEAAFNMVEETILLTDVDQEVDQCFTSNGCQQPLSALAVKIASALSIGEDKTTNNVVQCFGDFASSVFDKINNCSSCVFPLAQLSDMELDVKTSGNLLQRTLDVGLTISEAIDDTSICSPDQAPAVQNCINQLTTEIQPQVKARVDKLCEENTKCQLGLEPSCHSAIGDYIHESLKNSCQLAKDQTIYEPLFQCLGMTGSPGHQQIIDTFIANFQKSICDDMPQISSVCPPQS